MAEIGAVDEEQDAARAGVLDEPVGEGAGGVGLARAGGHLDQRAGLVLGERLFQAGDGFDLAVAHAERDERVCRRHRLQTYPQRVRFGEPRGQRLRLAPDRSKTGMDACSRFETPVVGPSSATDETRSRR